MRRCSPNILVTGTPATGKSTICSRLQEKLKEYQLINVSQFAKDNNLYDGYDEEFECNIIDEEQLVEKLTPIFENSSGGVIIDFHGCDLFPEDWFDAVFVIRTSNTVLYDRLVERGYSERKLKNNVECEIFQTILDEAKEAFDENVVHELQNEVTEDISNNVETIVTFINNWPKKD
ncbi:TAF9 RNA polymerase II: TATA box binding protein (TBP)-associated factor-like protein [Leptotrombidium deliense]|uniref:Adenylate kinase isoenzyme 6 homolog n=1 Tax=Leptotrombidium deliense TaxID=299467 RepID=A0A443SIZ2_9ACAR|nr:TAF9 RNA polymerase II: TATA box binding protein (TBP)-associated factor-like protein [Leptotrombidium deliense]